MKRLIIAMMLCATLAQAQTTNQYVVNSDGTYFYSKGGGTNAYVRFSKAVEYAVLTWSSADLANKALDIFGTDYNTESSGITINSATPDTFTAYNDHVIFEVTAIATTGTVTVAGQRVDEDDNTITNFSEAVSITATGCYQTAAKFIGACTNSTPSADITTDVNLASYFDFQNQDFTVSNIRMSFKPSNPSWDVGVELLILQNDGSTSNLLNGGFDFRASDTPPRAANGLQGHAKQNITSRLILGSENEGIIVKILGGGDATPANITEFDLTIGCELQ